MSYLDRRRLIRRVLKLDIPAEPKLTLIALAAHIKPEQPPDIPLLARLTGKSKLTVRRHLADHRVTFEELL